MIGQIPPARQRRALLGSAAVPTVVALFGLALALAGTWPAPGALSGGAPRILAFDLPGALVALLLLAGIALSVALLFIVLPQPRRKDPDEFQLEPPPPPRLSPAAIAVLLAALLASLGAIVWMVFFLGHQQRRTSGAHQIAMPTLFHHVAPSVAPAVLHARVAGWGITAVLGVLAIGAIGFALWLIAENRWVLLRRPPRRRRLSRLAEALDAATGSAIEELINDPDPRRAVIACYRRCERVVAEEHRPRYPWQTPREFIATAMAALALPASAVAALLGVFERARFSNIAMRASDREIALRALASIRAALANRGAHDAGH